MSSLFTDAMQARLQQLEFAEANRKEKARRATQKWREENIERVLAARNAAKQARADMLLELKCLRAAHELKQRAIKEGDINVHDASLDQML